MSIGSGIALFVIGAILAFAVNVQLEFIDLGLIGYILMGAGFLIFVLGLVLMARKRQSSTTTRSAVDPNSGEAVQRRTTTSNDDPLI
jgi:membrane protein implicated in regulation of membrane protease activity